MDSLLKLPVVNGASIRILQITDTHLFSGRHETLLGVNTWASFNAVLDAIKAERQPIDLIIATGDLAQDQTPEAYQHFAEGITRLPAPCVWLPGNHDFQPVMYDTLVQCGIAEARQVFIGERWQLLLLDSQVAGVPYGMLSDYQLDWLAKKLAQTAHRHMLILLHHHPLPSGCSWLDQHSLRNPHALQAILQPYPLANTLICGHIHQEMDVEWHGRRLLATPSTCVQFRPHCTRFTIDAVAPGWRWLELNENGTLQTRVQRLASRVFTPDLDSEGY